MFQIEMRFQGRKRSGGEYLFKKGFYINLLDGDAAIQCGTFLLVYGMEILSGFNQGKKKNR